MVSTKNQQMTEEEYRYISTFLGNKNFLIFGTGFDSELWRYSNKDGVTLFLEHNDQWILNSNDTYKVKYTTHKKRDSQRLLELYKQNITNELNIDLPDIVLNTNWDIILVDSPEGGKNCHPGRMQSIYAAKHLSKLGTEIFIHDCDREVEDIYSKTMFNNLIKQLTKLRHYRV
jgi:uncharacterized protein (TIGR01627 family)